MRWFGRRGVLDQPRVEEPERPPVEFLGAAPGESTRALFLYEFLTDTGVMVRLHDMQFLGVDHRAGDAELTIRFVYDDPTCTPPEAVDTPVAVFRFDDVQVQRREDMDDAGSDPNRVCHMEYHEHNRLISLSTGRTHLVLAARRMRVSMEPPG